MEVNNFEILLIKVAFCVQHVQKFVFNLLLKIKNPNRMVTGSQTVKLTLAWHLVPLELEGAKLPLDKVAV